MFLSHLNFIFYKKKEIDIIIEIYIFVIKPIKKKRSNDRLIVEKKRFNLFHLEENEVYTQAITSKIKYVDPKSL